MKEPNSRIFLLLSGMRDQLVVRRRERAFHPQSRQKVLNLSPQVFILLRMSLEGDEAILTLTGVAGEAVALKIPLDEAGLSRGFYKDLLSGSEYEADGNILNLTLPPAAYGGRRVRSRLAGRFIHPV